MEQRKKALAKFDFYRDPYSVMHAKEKPENLLDIVPFHDLQCPIRMSKHGKTKYRLRDDDATRLLASNTAKRFAGTS